MRKTNQKPNCRTMVKKMNEKRGTRTGNIPLLIY
jgi:hypothetical protein